LNPLLKNSTFFRQYNGRGVPKHCEEVGSEREYLALLVFNATWRAESAGKLLELKWSFGIIGLNWPGVLQKECQSMQERC
jgi:hypothetical protein